MGEITKGRYDVPAPLEYKTIHDAASGREYKYIDLHGARAIRPYVTAQHWSSDGRKFIFHNDETQELYEYDTCEQLVKKLDDSTASVACTDAVVTPQDKIVYRKNGNELWIMDWKTGEKRKAAQIPDGAQTSVYQVTNDCKYLTCYWTQERTSEDIFNGERLLHIIPRCDLETGEWDLSLRHRFTDTPKFPHAGHPQINPEDPDLMMFCHEGTTMYIHDRIWVGRVSTGKSHVLFEQAYENTEFTAETTGHEVWAQDGKSVSFVKYYLPDYNIGVQGLVRVRLDGSREYINNDYRYWHCYPSADNNWIAADTQLCTAAEIVLANTNIYTSHLLARFAAPENPQHPYQPHPVISPDSRMVSWQMINGDGVLGIGFADISDLTCDSKVQSVEPVSHSVSMITHPEAVSAVGRREDESGGYYVIGRGHGMYCRTDKDEAPCRSVKLRVTYLDDGFTPIVIKYTGARKRPEDLAARENKERSIYCSATNEWKTRDIVLDDACLLHAGKFGSDFYIAGENTRAFIKNVELI